MTNPWLLLGTAIVAEGIGTSGLKASAGFTRLGPSLVVAGYGVAFYLLSLTLRHAPAGVAYAAWSGLGIVLIAAVGPTALWMHTTHVYPLPRPGRRPR